MSVERLRLMTFLAESLSATTQLAEECPIEFLVEMEAQFRREAAQAINQAFRSGEEEFAVQGDNMSPLFNEVSLLANWLEQLVDERLGVDDDVSGDRQSENSGGDEAVEVVSPSFWEQDSAGNWAETDHAFADVFYEMESDETGGSEFADN